MKININKTTCTIFSKSNTVAKEKVSLKIGGHKLDKSRQPCLFGGVTLDWHLKFNEHIQLLKEKTTKRLKTGVYIPKPNLKFFPNPYRNPSPLFSDISSPFSLFLPFPPLFYLLSSLFPLPFHFFLPFSLFSPFPSLFPS